MPCCVPSRLRYLNAVLPINTVPCDMGGMLTHMLFCSSVRLAATKALLGSIDFIKSNFDREVERNYIMQVRVHACAVIAHNLPLVHYLCTRQKAAHDK